MEKPIRRGPGTVAATNRPVAPWPLIGAATTGALIALSLGVYGHLHQPTGLAVAPFRPDNLAAVKSALATVAVGLAVGQLVSALWLYGRLGPVRAPSWLGPVHRWAGTAAFVTSLPVAYHCLWTFGFQSTTPRVLAHGLLGCAFYGAFATKLLLLRSDRIPGWALPVAGGAVVALMVAAWFTSAWFWFLA